MEPARGVNLSSLVGDTFQLFNWSGVNPTGSFNIVADPGWDVSHLYTTGQVTYVGTVPEPSTLVLLGAGAITLLAYAFRRHSKSPNPPPLRCWSRHCWDSQGHLVCGGVGESVTTANSRSSNPLRIQDHQRRT